MHAPVRSHETSPFASWLPDCSVIKIAALPGRGKTSVAINMRGVWETLSRTLGRLDAAERSFVKNQIFLEAERFAQERDVLRSEMSLPQLYRAEPIVEQRGQDESDWFRWYWRALARIESRVRVHRKGTVRSGSRNGSQVCCTHVVPVYESDAKARWLLGLLSEFRRLTRVVRVQFNWIVSSWADVQHRRVFKNQTFELCAA